jgi:hypothetical protein
MNLLDLRPCEQECVEEMKRRKEFRGESNGLLTLVCVLMGLLLVITSACVVMVYLAIN